MSGKTFNSSDFNGVQPLTNRNKILTLSALVIIVVVGLLLQPRIAARLSQSPAVPSPADEGARFTADWYQWYKDNAIGDATISSPGFPLADEGARFTTDWYQWYKTHVLTNVTTASIPSPADEGARFTADWYQWYKDNMMTK